MVLTVGVASAKGGVGKTTVVVNLGHALTEFGREVIAVDADLRRPHLGLILGYEETPKCVHTAISGMHSIEDCTYLHPCGLRIIPGDSDHHGSMGNADHGKFYELLMAFHKKTEVIIVDTPPGVDPSQKSVYAGLDGLIIVTTPDKPGVNDAIRTMHVARETGVKIMGIVINKAQEHDDELDAVRIETMLNIPVIGIIPYSKDILEAKKFKHPVTYANVSCPASIAFKKLAANLIGEKYVPDIEKEDKHPLDDVLRRIGFKD